MDYCLDAGDGTASLWTAAPDIDLDGDGRFDGVRMDLDGDGIFDDALADGDGDGLADHAALDLDDDGRPESGVTDDGSGTWAGGAGGVRPLRWLGIDGAEHTGTPADVDADGVPDHLADVDRDGVADRVFLGDAGGLANEAYVDTDEDGRWDIRLLDADGDGAADSTGAL